MGQSSGESGDVGIEDEGVRFQCPRCFEVLERHHERCPSCDKALGEEFCATYHPSTSRAAKLIACVFLIGGLVLALAALIALLVS